MNFQKYPIGTRIKWVLPLHFANGLAKKDIGKIGKIVGYRKGGTIFIFLPESTHFASNSTSDLPISWWACWKHIEILPIKGQQLMFDFAYER